jgi:hypothetical protein
VRLVRGTIADLPQWWYDQDATVEWSREPALHRCAHVEGLPALRAVRVRHQEQQCWRGAPIGLERLPTAEQRAEQCLWSARVE